MGYLGVLADRQHDQGGLWPVEGRHKLGRGPKVNGIIGA